MEIRGGVPHPACEKIRIRMTADNAEGERHGLRWNDSGFAGGSR